MTNTPNTRKLIAQTTLKHFSPLIRRSLFDDKSFRENYGLKTKSLITFVDSNISFQRSILFDAIRSVLGGTDTTDVSDAKGSVWTLKNEDYGDGLPSLVLISTGRRLDLPGFAVLSGDASVRIRSLDEAAYDLNMSSAPLNYWRQILNERAIEDDEVDAFLSELCDMPVHVERAIREKIATGESNVSAFVPNSQRYFEQLVGVYDGSSSVRDYAAGVGRRLFEKLTDWRPYEGLLFSLLLSSHSTLTAEISVNQLGQEKLLQIFDYLEKQGDVLSQMGALEIGIRVLPEMPEIEPYLVRIVHQIRDDDLEYKSSGFKIFSALFVLVDGELARTRLFADKPPFYRRLAALAHAALIQRQIIHYVIDYERFALWAFSSRSEQYYMQSLTDMRIEPRWAPDLAEAAQMKMEFFGRIMIAGRIYEANIGPGELRNTIIDTGEQSLSALCDFPRPYFPGPLEGTAVSAMPDDFARIIEEQLAKDQIEASSFIALVNSAMMFNITSGHAELAAKALRLCSYTLANLVDKSQLVGILNGLATVAAVSRTPSLANELRILVRRYRRDPQYCISIEEAMRMCLVASAAWEELIEWREFAGKWLTELAFSEFQGGEGDTLYSHLLALLHSVPELWISCARAEAALQAWCYSRL